ncbi:hypothetical protein JDV02_001954 [Purpureocillium takamizusanense]|uniref:Uncharacterized protein n=1 Tax=Purpureocillium takamizusanense TaxID=2060973 RepID=A0A9Q8QAD2_9HYPO|nr:uncharacterized protein JDV02_001954 [Purpureocillium takamizusanense]UNI15419.1 hypothetical protein JDV02_001954 [Purpureocillium takamizusanense]
MGWFKKTKDAGKEPPKYEHAVNAPAAAPAASAAGGLGGGEGVAARDAGESAAAAAADDASSVDHVADAKKPKEKLTRRQKLRNQQQKVKAHCRRFWLWYLIGTIIFLAILLPIVFKVIVPAIVQAILNSQDLPVHSGALQALTPERTILSLNTSLDTPLPVNIDTLPLYLYNHDTEPYSPFVTLTLPKQRVSGDTPAIITNQTVVVANETELVRWFDRVFVQDEVELSVRADPTIHLGELTSTPHLDKTIKLPGLNNLKGFGITELTVMLPPQDGKNIKGMLNLPNSGVLTLQLGNVTLNLLSGRIRLGEITIHNLNLPPGNNSCAFEGMLFLDTLGPNLATILADQAAPLGRGVIELNATGNATVVNGVHIPYIEKVLNTKKLTTSISVVTLLSDVLSGVVAGAGNGTSSGNNLIDVLGDVLGNSTFLGHVIEHWNTTAGGGGSGGGGGSNNNAANVKRAAQRGSMVWTMLKLGMKMKRAQGL